MVCRLTDQKGVGELFGPLYGSAFRICQDMDLQFAVSTFILEIPKIRTN
jgi:starch synthase